MKPPSTPLLFSGRRSRRHPSPAREARKSAAAASPVARAASPWVWNVARAASPWVWNVARAASPWVWNVARAASPWTAPCAALCNLGFRSTRLGVARHLEFPAAGGQRSASPCDAAPSRPLGFGILEFGIFLGFGISGFGISAASPALAASSAPPPRPNIILILSDDMGFSDIGCYGGEIRTPTLDRLAARGLRFTQFYNNARCCPTRAALLTGLYPHQAGIGHMVQDKKLPGYAGTLGANCMTIAEMLRPAGYATYALGKWHVSHGLDDTSNHPIQRGFDRYYGIIGGSANYFDPATLKRDNKDITPKTDPAYKPAKGHPYYLTDAISDNAVQFLKDHFRQNNITAAAGSAEIPLGDGAKRRQNPNGVPSYSPGLPESARATLGNNENKTTTPTGLPPATQTPPPVTTARQRPIQNRESKIENSKPFFMYIAYTAAHWPMHALPEDIAKYKGKYDNGYDPHREARHKRAIELGLITPKTKLSPPSNRGWDTVKNKAWEARCMEVYAAMIDRMDQGIGRIVAQLEAAGQLDNTIILYLQDNGACAEPEGRKPNFKKGYNTGPDFMPGPKETWIGYGRDWANVSNTPFREYKHWVHEGGIATPLVVHWPAGIDPKLAGTLVRTPAHLIDIAATCLDIAAAQYPAHRSGGFQPPDATQSRPTINRKLKTANSTSGAAAPSDIPQSALRTPHSGGGSAAVPLTPLPGISLRPAFTGATPQRPEPLFWEHEGNRAVRDGRWKLVAKGARGAWELYDMEADRSELNNLAEKHKDTVARLSAAWQKWAVSANVLPWPWADNKTGKVTRQTKKATTVPREDEEGG